MFLTANGQVLGYAGNKSRPLFDESNPLFQQYYLEHVEGILAAGYDGIFTDNWWNSQYSSGINQISSTKFSQVQQGINQLGGMIENAIGDKFLVGNSAPTSTYTNRDVCMLENRVDDVLGTNDKSIAAYFRYSDLAQSLHQVCLDTYLDVSYGPFETFRLPINLLTNNILGLSKVLF